MPTVTALLVGDLERTEFREAVAALRASSHLVLAPKVAAAEALLQEGLAPDLLVLAQAFPGQFSAEAVERLRRQAPLARVVGLLGSWCEGEVRTGRPWPGAVRVYWHQWLPRCRRELHELAEGCCSSWALPSTASDEERFLVAPALPSGRQGLVAIHARQFDVYAWLVAACRRMGYATLWLREEQPIHATGIDAILFDFGGELEAELEQLCQLTKLPGPIPVVALVNFPRVEDRDRLQKVGVTALLSKPLLVEDLADELARFIDGPVVGGTRAAAPTGE